MRVTMDTTNPVVRRPHNVSRTEEVWNEFGTTLRKFIRRRVKDDHVADDLLQEVFVRVHDKLGSLADEERLSAWLFRIARNVVTDHYRRNEPVELTEESVETESSDAAENINEQVGHWLVSLIAELPEEYRDAVTLAELQGVRQTEIAKIIGMSSSGTKSRVQRGRKMLKDLLLQCCHFELDRRGNVIDYARRPDCITCCETTTDP